MLKVESKILVGDNSGARIVKCIHILGSGNKRFGALGDFLIVAIPNRRVVRRLITKNLYLALIVLVNRNVYRRQGYFIKSKRNKVVLLSDYGRLVGSRLSGLILKEVYRSGLKKILSIARGVI